MDRYKLPQAGMKYQPASKRNTGRPLKRVLDCNIGNEMGHETLVLENMMMRRRMMMMMMNTTTTAATAAFHQ
jgi:hypothetical protein